MIDAICEAIARTSPFTAHEIQAAYRVYKSFDLIVAACDLSVTSGIASLGACLEMLTQAADHICSDCGAPLQLVRPGQWQCPFGPHS